MDGRLKATLYPESRLEQYLYDEAGNVPAAPVKRSAREIAFRLPGHHKGRVVERVTQTAGWTLRYDGDANLIAKEREGARWTYEYDSANRLARVHTPAGGSVTFAYDPLGRRVAKTSGAGTTRFLWDGGLLLGETSEAAEPREYVFDPGSFAPAAVLGGTEDLLLETDQIGTPRTAYSRAGDVSWEADFSAWGETPHARKAAADDADELRLRFPGQYEDAETELCYNRFRYYDPELRAYTQSDPLGLVGGGRPHAYVKTPVKLIDPLGLMPWRWDPNGMGHHLVPRKKAESAGLDLLATQRDTPTYFPKPYVPGMHEDIHRAQAPHIGPLQRPWTGTADELLNASRAGLPSVDHMRGERRIPRGNIVLLENATPTEAFDELMRWHREQFKKGCP